jgi:hypothetical protein
LLDSKAMWTPAGINLAGATGVPFLAFAFAPVTWLWGPIVAYNLAVILAPVTAGCAMFWLCRHITRSAWAALIGGAIYAFSSFEISQTSGHLHLIYTCFQPLLLLCVLKYVEGEISRRRLALWVTPLLLAQFLTSTEIFAMGVILGVVALACAFALLGPEVRARLRSSLPPLAFALFVTLALMAFYIHDEIHAPAYAKNLGPLFYNTDVLSFLTPMPYTWIGGPVFQSVTGLFQAGPGETNAYIGVPMVILVLRYLFTRWNLRSTRLLSAMLAVVTLWVLGPRLYVAGKPTIWLPYSLFDSLPGFNQMLQGRVAVFLVLLSAVVVAKWLASPRHRQVWLRWGTAALAVAFVLPNLVNVAPSYAGTWLNPVFFKTDLYKRYLRPGENIMPILWGGFSESPMWQAEDHMYWNMANGYFRITPPAGWGNRLTSDLWSNTPGPLDGRRLRTFVRAHGVQAVIVTDDEMAKWGPTVWAAHLGSGVNVGGVTLFRVPSSRQAAQ